MNRNGRDDEHVGSDGNNSGNGTGSINAGGCSQTLQRVAAVCAHAPTFDELVDPVLAEIIGVPGLNLVALYLLVAPSDQPPDGLVLAGYRGGATLPSPSPPPPTLPPPTPSPPTPSPPTPSAAPLWSDPPDVVRQATVRGEPTQLPWGDDAAGGRWGYRFAPMAR